MSNQVAVLMRKAPYGSVYTAEGFRSMMGIGVFEMDISAIFVDDGVYALIKAAYQSRDRFQKHIDALTAAEAEVDRELIVKLGESDKLKAKITAEQKQLEERRRKILEEVF